MLLRKARMRPPFICAITSLLYVLHVELTRASDPHRTADGAASLFRWSADGKYLARKGKDLISIYELPSMRLLDVKSLKVRAFWS